MLPQTYTRPHPLALSQTQNRSNFRQEMQKIFIRSVQPLSSGLGEAKPTTLPSRQARDKKMARSFEYQTFFSFGG